MYQITFNSIQCIMPSAGVEISSTQAYNNVKGILQDGLDTAADIVDIAVPEVGEIIGTGLEIVGEIANVAGDIANLVVAVEKQARNDGKEPDQFYISWCMSNELTPAENISHNDGSAALYPKMGVSPSNFQNNVELAKNNFAPNLPFTWTTPYDGIKDPFSNNTYPITFTICFWDYDRDSSDDLLFTFPLDDNHVGSFQKTIYNGIQDCTYYIDWTVEKITPAQPQPPIVTPTISLNANPTAIVQDNYTHTFYTNSLGNIIDVRQDASTGETTLWDMMQMASTSNPTPAQSDPFPFIDNNNQLHVFYVDVYGNIADIHLIDSSWSFVNISQTLNNSGKPVTLPGRTPSDNSTVQGSLVGYRLSPIIFSGNLHVLYTDITGQICSVFTSDSSSWNYVSISGMVANNTVQAVSNPKPILYYNANSGQTEFHILYKDGKASRLNDLFALDGNIWQVNEITTENEIAFDPSPILFGDKIHVYCNVSGWMYDASYDGTQWNVTYINGFFNVCIVGGPLALFTNNQMAKILFHTTESIQCLTLDTVNSDRWTMENPLDSASNAGYQPAYPAGSANNNTRSSNDPLLNISQGLPYAVQSSDGHMQVVYTDVNQNISALNFDGTNWTYQILPSQNA
jgi:hypothetical protein